MTEGNADGTSPREPLTANETRVLQAAADGQATQLIAIELTESVSSISHLFERIYIKLEAVDRAHAVAQGFRAELLR